LATPFDRSPYETLDALGVGQLVRMGAWLGRTTKPHLKLGVCGEHGGDPDSIAFFHRVVVSVPMQFHRASVGAACLAL